VGRPLGGQETSGESRSTLDEGSDYSSERRDHGHHPNKKIERTSIEKMRLTPEITFRSAIDAG